MGFLDRLFGAQDDVAPAAPRRVARTEDERAIERYRYLLSTAPPETIEQVHAEAFSRLTEAQRAQVYEELSKGAGTGERPLSSEPATLARAATRKEMRDPGSLERTLTGPSFGSMVGSTLLGTVAGYVIGSALVSAFLPWDAGYDAAGDSGSDASSSDASADAGADSSGDFGSGFDGGGDFGGGDFGF
jgi:hypothetical protein